MTAIHARITRFIRWLHLALIAPLTPRDQLIEALDAALSENPRGVQECVLLIAEIDDLQSLRSQYDAPVFAQVLQTLEHRLRGSILSRDVVVQLLEGQFAICLNPLRAIDEDDVMMIVGQIQDTVAVPIIHAKTHAKVTTSIGCAIASTAGLTTGVALLEAGRIAQFEAAQKGPGALRFYAPEMGKKAKLQHTLGQELDDAFKSGAIHAHFQPQVSLPDQTISGFEALARWQHDTYGLIAPADFLPVIRRAGAMPKLCQIILHNALDALEVWDAADLHVPSISINMCTEALGSPQMVAVVQSALADHNLTADRLVIEVLETVGVVDACDQIAKNLRALSDLGCRIDLDDYGTGQTSIKSVRSFGVDRIKIDRSFVTHVDQDPEQQQIIRTILSMAQNLDVDTLAEGVESDAELSHLEHSGCGYAQGYAIARPLPPPETIAWMKSRNRTHAKASAGP